MKKALIVIGLFIGTFSTFEVKAFSGSIEDLITSEQTNAIVWHVNNGVRMNITSKKYDADLIGTLRNYDFLMPDGINTKKRIVPLGINVLLSSASAQLIQDTQDRFPKTGIEVDMLKDFIANGQIEATVLHLSNGIDLTLTSEDASLVEKLKIQPFLVSKNISVKKTKISNGVNLLMTSTSDEFVQYLQEQFPEPNALPASEIRISKTDGISDGETIVAGDNYITFLKFVLDNNDSGDVNVTSATILATGTDAAATYSNFTAGVFINGVQQGSVKNLDATTTFDDLSVIIPSAGQTEFTIVLDTIDASADEDEIADTLSIDVTDIVADNVANGQTVVVTEGGTDLSASNALEGSLFTLVQSGTLAISVDSIIPSDILVSNSTDVEVLKVRLSATNDEIHVKDLYFENDVDGDGNPDNIGIENYLEFKLYNEVGELIQAKIMTAGSLHFELANQDRIQVPKDDSIFVTVKVDVRDLTNADKSNSLVLSLDADNTIHYGAEAVTASTGNDLTPKFCGDVASEEFSLTE